MLAEVAERLRRLTRNQLGSSRAGSNPADNANFLVVGYHELKKKAEEHALI